MLSAPLESDLQLMSFTSPLASLNVLPATLASGSVIPATLDSESLLPATIGGAEESGMFPAVVQDNYSSEQFTTESSEELNSESTYQDSQNITDRIEGTIEDLENLDPWA